MIRTKFHLYREYLMLFKQTRLKNARGTWQIDLFFMLSKTFFSLISLMVWNCYMHSKYIGQVWTKIVHGICIDPYYNLPRVSIRMSVATPRRPLFPLISSQTQLNSFMVPWFEWSALHVVKKWTTTVHAIKPWGNHI